MGRTTIESHHSFNPPSSAACYSQVIEMCRSYYIVIHVAELAHLGVLLYAPPPHKKKGKEKTKVRG